MDTFLEEEWDSIISSVNNEELNKQIHEALLNLHLIVSFGRGTWGGSEDDYTLIYNQKQDRFYWVWIDRIDETFEIRHVQETDKIFSILDKKFPHDDIVDYLEIYFKTLPKENIDALGFSFLSLGDFVYNVWWSLAKSFYQTQSKLKRELDKSAKNKKQAYLESLLKRSSVNVNKSLFIENGKLYVKLTDTESFELKIEKERYL